MKALSISTIQQLAGGKQLPIMRPEHLGILPWPCVREPNFIEMPTVIFPYW